MRTKSPHLYKEYDIFMNRNTFRPVLILCYDRLEFSQHRQIFLGLCFALCIFSSSYSQADGYPNEIAQVQISDNLTSPPSPPSIALRADMQEVTVALIDSGYGMDETDIPTYSLWENQAEAQGTAGIDDDDNGFIDDIHGWDWIGDDNSTDDELGHGTQVGKAILDIAEQHATSREAVKIQPLRILRADGKGEIADLVDALGYTLRKGVRIANISLVSYYNAPALEEAIRIASEEGLLIIADAGNLATRVYWPAAYPETFAVSSINHSSADGCSGGNVDIMVSSDDATSHSEATPAVTAVAALLLFQHPDWSIETIVNTILSTADYTFGLPPRLDIEAALNAGLTFDAPKLEFGEIVTGTAKTLSLEVTNITTQTATYQLDTFESDDGCISATTSDSLTFDQSSITLAPNSSETVNVTLDAAASRALGQSRTFISLTSEERHATLVAWSQVVTDQTEPSGQEGQTRFYLPFFAR